MIGDIADQVIFPGNKRYRRDIWKALLVEQFAFDKAEMGEPLVHSGETIVSLDGKRIITVRPSTRQFKVSEAAEFIEYLYAKGSEYAVKWSERALAVYSNYKEAA